MSENTEPKPIVKSKVMWVNAILFVIALVGLVQNSVQLPPEAMGYLLLVVTICNMVLRYFFTDSAVKVK